LHAIALGRRRPPRFRLRREDFELHPRRKRLGGVPRRPFLHSRFPLFKAGSAGIPAASGDEGVMTSEKFFELGYRIEEIASSSGKIQGGEDSGWYYGRPDAEGNLGEKVGPFDTYAEAMKHLEEELFADDED
jgi:hypothetical protein